MNQAAAKQAVSRLSESLEKYLNRVAASLVRVVPGYRRNFQVESLRRAIADVGITKGQFDALMAHLITANDRVFTQPTPTATGAIFLARDQVYAEGMQIDFQVELAFGIRLSVVVTPLNVRYIGSGHALSAKDAQTFLENVAARAGVTVPQLLSPAQASA